MGLLGNSFRSEFGAVTAWGTTRAFSPGNRAKRQLFIQSLGHEFDIVIQSLLANPVGSNGASSWQQPRVGGQVAIRATGGGELTALAVPEKIMTVDFTGGGGLSAIASLVISAICAMNGSGTLTASVAGVFNASIDFSGSGGLNASVVGIASAITNLIGSGDLSADMVGIAEASIDITVTGTGLTIDNVGPAVWGVLASLNNDPGTMGELLNSAGGGASPSIIAAAVWDEIASGHTIPGSFADELRKKLTQNNFIALKK